jgi:hypothetical protein
MSWNEWDEYKEMLAQEEYEKKFRERVLSENQSEKGGRRWWKSEDERNDRDKEMFEHFKLTHLTPSSFSEDKKNHKKYRLKSRRIRAIIEKALGSEPVNCLNT